MRLLLVRALAVLCLSTVVTADGETILSLNGNWTFFNQAHYEEQIKLSGIVPGDIYSDLYRAGRISAPLYADNDVRLRWVARENWTYSRDFTLDSGFLKKAAVLLVFDGIDTVASVYLNGEKILDANNQFLRHTLNVKKILKEGRNSIEVRFVSPVDYVEEQAKKYEKTYGHTIPADCTPLIYNGECRPNFIRKIQASFAWDWGPAFPTVGLWQSARFVAFDDFFIEELRATTKRTDSSFNVTVEAVVRVAKGGPAMWTVSFPELQVDFKQAVLLLEDVTKPSLLTAVIPVPRSKVELWWPNGFGGQKLYAVTTSILGGKVPASRSINIGFRHIELVQDPINPANASAGRHFFFRVNDAPIFLKGTNWIPVDPFPAQDHTTRLEFLMESSRIAGMNAMRVWGGGRYESEQFYDLADRKGLLLWQDLMFACSLYPTDPDFLDNVKQEIQQQVNRLKSRASILVWAGNNENELAIRGHWYGTLNYSEDEEIVDYIKLYASTIRPVVESLDSSRPFLLSSPSNGIETDQEGGVAKQPGSEYFGDVHFYNEIENLWNASTFPIPRCATEYGVQSIPPRSTMAKWMTDDDYYYFSGNFTHRQHHPGGELFLLTMIFSHFPAPKDCGDANIDAEGYVRLQPTFTDRFAYFTQLHQAIAYKTETEHYLRHRGRIGEDGRGNTMCALYWQLNDVWAAPTWSSIDYNLRWKPAHYEARRFFAPTIISIYLNNSHLLEAFVVNSRAEELKGLQIQIKVFAWENGFTPIFSVDRAMDIPAFSSTEVPVVTTVNNYLNALGIVLEDLVFYASITNPTTSELLHESSLVPDKFYHVDLSVTGGVKIDAVKRLTPRQFELQIAASAVAPFVWLDVQRKEVPPFFFSDNAFTMTTKRRTIILEFSSDVTNDITLSDISACALKDCYA